MSKPPRIMFYHDGRHPLIYMYEPPMQKEEYQHAVDEIAGTPIDVLMFGVGDGRTVLYDTKVGELWGHHLDRWNHAIWRRTHQNARSLIDEGHDPLQVVTERAHDKGMLIYTVLLVQMPSGERGGEETLNTRGSLFRFENKQWDIGAASDLDPEWPGYECADFKHQEIRDERFTLIDEMLSNYPVNGLELSLVHHPYYFHPNEVDEGREIMTDWIRRVYEAVKSGGEERELVIQVPNSIDEALSIGLDVPAWIEQGIVDVLVAAETTGSNLLNTMADFRPVVEAARGSGVRVYATIKSRRLRPARLRHYRNDTCRCDELLAVGRRRALLGTLARALAVHFRPIRDTPRAPPPRRDGLSRQDLHHADREPPPQHARTRWCAVRAAAENVGSGQP